MGRVPEQKIDSNPNLFPNNDKTYSNELKIKITNRELQILSMRYYHLRLHLFHLIKKTCTWDNLAHIFYGWKHCHCAIWNMQNVRFIFFKSKLIIPFPSYYIWNSFEFMMDFRLAKEGMSFGLWFYIVILLYFYQEPLLNRIFHLKSFGERFIACLWYQIQHELKEIRKKRNTWYLILSTDNSWANSWQLS